MDTPFHSMFSFRVWFLTGLLAVVSSASHPLVSAQEGDAATDRARSDHFETEVRPLLVTHCLECHAAGSEDIGGGLLLDSKAGWEAGGDLGPAIVPGKPDESWLIRAVRPADDALQMPPDQRLNPAQIQSLEKWIADGAFDPRDSASAGPAKDAIDIEAGREFWAFQPLDPTPARAAGLTTTTETEFRAEGPLDEILIAIWNANEVAPTTAAGRRDWLRRITFDLTGLPPSPGAVKRFTTDERPDLHSRAVDRLLASPAYGERWGRHWLNVARYADSNGMDENIAHGNAWRYRDWVVSAWNADQPYDEFVAEQLAGDLMGEGVSEETQIARTIATGFLSLGPKVLAEVDETKMEMDIIDEQVDTMGRAFLGLTLGCARCHDHKFDPIASRDYYALSGIFKSTRTMESFTKIAKWNEESIATSQEKELHAEAQARVAEQQASVDQFIAAANARLLERLESGAELPENPEAQYTEPEREQLTTLRNELTRLQGAVPTLPTAMAVVDLETPIDVPVHLRGSHLTLGQTVPRGFPEVLVPPAESPSVSSGKSGRLELARWIVSPQRSLTYRVIANRIWRWHFGEALVRTPDNFGELGERPTHPQLLDWLAYEYQENGLSSKRLHRTLLLSAWSRLSTLPSETASDDVANTLLTRARTRRLEAEEIRDAVLAVSGRLDRRMGGSLLHVGNREFLFDHTSKDETRYDVTRRSIYLPVIRNHLYDGFTIFDYNNAAVSSSDRRQSTVPSQALFLLNSPLVMESAKALTARVQEVPAGPERVAELYQLTLGRQPEDAEAERALRFVSESEGLDGWELVAQSLLISNEFLYVP